MTHHVNMTSGGLASWFSGMLIRDLMEPGDRLTCVFTDVKGENPSPHAGEDRDAYRLVLEGCAAIFDVELPSLTPTVDAIERAAAAVDAAPEWLIPNDEIALAIDEYAAYLHMRDLAEEHLAGRLVWLNEGRDIWQVFHDDRFLGNSRLANCSKFLKQQPARAWLDKHGDPAESVVYVGIDWTESHRLPAIENAYLPYRSRALLTEEPYHDKDAIRAACEAAGIAVPRAYLAGMSHNNCGGGCVRAGQGHFEILLRENPGRYRYWETMEQRTADYLEKDVTILKDTAHDRILAHLGLTPAAIGWRQEVRTRPNGAGSYSTRIPYALASGEPLPSAVPLSLRAFRERLADAPAMFDMLDVGGCGCFVQPLEEAGAM